MSYRAVKRLLGETSLERKCRFLFGGGLMLLITGSFYFYAKLNLRIIRDQNREQASLLVTPSLLTVHSRDAGISDDYLPIFAEVADSLQVADDAVRNYRFELLQTPATAPALTQAKVPPSDRRASDKTSRFAMSELLKRYDEKDRDSTDNTPLELVIENTESREFEYYRVVLARESCVNCHRQRQNDPNLKVGDMLGVAHISMPLAKTSREVQQNNAILIAMALVTASLAMGAAYAIVRYVIVKPVLHLKDVSDAIAHGELDQRADIRTGDEFEELSHAFNRMLRHLVTVQDELQHVNNNLDAKVDELAQANLSLHEMNKMKSEFLATMSHELRTPLNSILGFSDVLSGASNLDDKQRRFVTNISTSGQNLLTLINDILDLAKIEAGRMDLHVVEFSLSDLVERQTSHIRPLAERKNIELKWEVDPQLPLAQTDAGKLQQILTNLLSNAVKFTPEGGRIHVQVLWERAETESPSNPGNGHATTSSAQEWAMLIVADTGVGIPLDDQAMIFEKFRQGTVAPGEGDTLTREYEGTGLGLSIVKELSRLLGGEVMLDSEFGRGSTFSVRFPLHLQPSLEHDADSLTHQTVEFRKSAGVATGKEPTSTRDAG